MGIFTLAFCCFQLRHVTSDALWLEPAPHPFIMWHTLLPLVVSRPLPLTSVLATTSRDPIALDCGTGAWCQMTLGLPLELGVGLGLGLGLGLRNSTATWRVRIVGSFFCSVKFLWLCLIFELHNAANGRRLYNP